MSVQVLCPSCGSIGEVHRPPVRECSRCRADLPDALQRSINRALTEAQAPKPRLLILGQWCSLGAGLLFVIVMFLAPFDMGSYAIAGEAVSGPEFLRRGGWLFAVLGALLLTIGIGLWREGEWVRPLMVLYWLSAALLAFFSPNAAVGDVVGGIVSSLVAGAIAAWYLYRKPNVRAYFEARLPRASTPVDV